MRLTFLKMVVHARYDQNSVLLNYVNNLFINTSMRSEKLISCGPYRL